MCCGGEEESQEAAALQTKLKNAVKKAVPAWKDSEAAQITITQLFGGASGQGVYKVENITTPKLEPEAVLCKTGSEKSGALACAALQAFGKAGQANPERNFCGTVYMAGDSDPKFKGIQVTEFADGGSVAAGQMYTDEADGIAYGKCLGLMHSVDSAWYDDGKFEENDPDITKCTDAIGPEKTAEWKAAARMSTHGNMIFKMAVMSKGIGLDCKTFLTDRGLMGPNANTLPEEYTQANTWFTDIGNKIPEILNFITPGESTRFMDRVVVTHSDAHVGQFIHREKGVHGKLLLIDFDLLMKAPAWYDWGGIPEDWLSSGTFFNGGKYPSKEKRLKAAQAYIDAVEEEEVAKYSANTAEDVVFDVNKGICGRLLFKGLVMMMFLGLKQRDAVPHYLTWCFVALADVGSRLIKAAEADEAKRAELMEKGVIVASFEFIETTAGVSVMSDEFWADADANAKKVTDIPLGPVNQGNFVPSSCTVL